MGGVDSAGIDWAEKCAWDPVSAVVDEGIFPGYGARGGDIFVGGAEIFIRSEYGSWVWDLVWEEGGFIE